MCALIILPFASFCQTYIVQVEDREKTISLTNQAINLIDQKNIADAVSALIKAISIDSTYHSSYLILYKACLFDKNYSDTAIFYLKKGQRIFVEDDELTFYIGEIYRMNSDLTNAISEYTDAINYSKINGEDLELVHKYYFNRATCYLKKDLFDSAILDYDYTLKLKPDYSSAFINRGICLYKKGKSSDACADWYSALNLGAANARDYIDKYCKSKN